MTVGEKSSVMYEALEELLLELEDDAHKALDDFMVTAPITSFARLYDILQAVKS